MKRLKKPLNLLKDIKFHFAGKKVRILAAAVTVFMFLFILFHRNLFLDPTLEVAYGGILFAVALLCAPVCGLLIAVRVSVPERYEKLCNTILFFLMPVVTLQMVEAFNGKFIYNFSVPTFCLNYLMILCFYLVFYLLTNRMHMVGLIVNITLYVWSLLNYFIELFRGTPFIPMDIFSFGTGLSVAD